MRQVLVSLETSIACIIQVLKNDIWFSSMYRGTLNNNPQAV